MNANQQRNQGAGLAKSGGILDWIEFIGNKIPHPFILFLWLFFFVVAVSFICAQVGISAINPTTKEKVFVVSLLTSKQVGIFLRDMSKNFMTFAPMFCVPLCTLGIGVAHGTGLIDVTMKLTGVSKSPFALSYIVALIGVCANLLGDAGFLILPILVAMIFQSVGRNPLAGMLLAYCSNCAGYGANLLVSTGDAVLAGLTEEAAHIIDPSYVATPVLGWYFMAASSFVISGVCAFVSLKIVEPRMRKTGIGENIQVVKFTEKDLIITADEKRGLRAVLVTLVLLIVAAVFMCRQGMPWSAPKGGSVVNGLMLKSVPTIIFIVFGLCGYVYGKVTGTLKKFGEIIPMMTKEFGTLNGYFVTMLAASWFNTAFNISKLGTIIAIKGGQFLNGLALPSVVILILLVLVCAVINIFLGSATAKYALMASTFVPMMMVVGISPAGMQVAYRIGDSLTNCITPVFPYLAFILDYAQRYESRAKTGTVIAYALPYSICVSVVWIAFLVVWETLGLPIGPGYYFSL